MASKRSPSRPEVATLSDLGARQRVLLDAHMARRQAHEEACLKMLRAEQQFEQAATFGYDEAAGPAAPLSTPSLLAQW